MKLAFKINLLFTAIVTLIILGMAVLIFILSKENVNRNFKTQLTSRAGRSAYLYNLFKSDSTNLLKSLDANSPPVLFNKNINIYNKAYQELYEFHDQNVHVLNADSNWLSEAEENGEFYLSQDKKEIGVFAFDTGILVLVAAENVSGKAYINDLKRIVVIYFPVAVLVTLLIGFLFSGTIVKPIKQTIHDVKLITSQNLSHRLFIGKRKDELAELNQTFNALLNRLEESFAMEKRFISNASHELSNPLTSISSQVEVALLKERDSSAYKKVLSSVLHDAQGLHQLVRNLLEIAKAGTHGLISLEKVRLDEIMIKAHSVVLRSNPAYKIELAFPDLPEDENECMIFGNATLLNSAFKNLMENGCKYSPDNKTRVELFFRGTEVEIEFNNKSEFLSPEEVEKLVEPFYRSSNSENQPGVGLGLTLTQRIIGLHKGSLTIHSNEQQGTTISVILPTLKNAQF
jgi:signal transduction histidine kinase